MCGSNFHPRPYARLQTKGKSNEENVEHPDGINAGGFANMMVESAAAARIIDFPASYHNGAGGISFADGHAEIRKWVDPRTRAPVRYNNQLALNVASPNNQDVIWLADRTSSRLK